MNHVYNILDTLKDTLRADESVNTVTFGQLSDIDLDKTTIFPLSHIILGNTVHKENTLEFNFQILMADVVDINKDENEFDDFYGNDNLQDVLNTQFEVGNRLISLMQRGNLFRNFYQITSQPVLSPFMERFSNVLAGYELDVTIEVKNGFKLCEDSSSVSSSGSSGSSGSGGSGGSGGNPTQNLPPNIALRDGDTYDLPLNTGYSLNIKTFNTVDSYSIVTTIEGLQISAAGVLFGTVTGVNRVDTVTITATNAYGSDSVTLNFNITDEVIEEDPKNADANNNFTGNPSAENSDSVGIFAEVPSEFEGNNIPYAVKEVGKRFFVRIGVPYLFQLSIENNGSVGDRVTYVSNVFSDIKFFPAMNRFYGVPTGSPRTESVEVTVENSVGSNSTNFDFELITNEGIDTFFAPYNLRATEIDRDLPDKGFFLRFNRREYSGVVKGIEVYKNGGLLYSTTNIIDGYSMSTELLQFHFGTNTWKIRMFNDLGEFTDFSEEITVIV